MSMHKIPLTADEREGMQSHGLDIGTPSQLSDVFRQGMAWANSKAAAECERLRSPAPVCLCGLRTTLNPHPDAGKPEHFLKVGAVYVCIPCLNKANHGHCKEANKLRIERDAALAELATVKKVAYGNLELLDETELLKAELAALKGGQDELQAQKELMEQALSDLWSVRIDKIKSHCMDAAPPAQASAWPEGWKLVPVEPTPKMIDVAVSHALMVSLSSDYNWSAYMRDVWCRMVAAAPAPGASDGKEGE